MEIESCDAVPLLSSTTPAFGDEMRPTAVRLLMKLSQTELDIWLILVRSPNGEYLRFPTYNRDTSKPTVQQITKRFALKPVREISEVGC